MKSKFKRAIKEYGATVIVFHVSMSLTSLAICYTAVTRLDQHIQVLEQSQTGLPHHSWFYCVHSGLDVPALMARVGIESELLSSKLGGGASNFVVAYAVHKVMSPIRITITLTSVPFIVRYLRRIGFLKAPGV